MESNISLSSFYNEDSECLFVNAKVSGKLTKEHYKYIVPELDKIMLSLNDKKCRVLFELVDFHGWTLGALIEDFKIGIKHANDIDRLAIVGDADWEEKLSKIADFFLKSEIQYFENKESARDWLACESRL
jgi:hypothetical protein